MSKVPFNLAVDWIMGRTLREDAGRVQSQGLQMEPFSYLEKLDFATI